MFDHRAFLQLLTGIKQGIKENTIKENRKQQYGWESEGVNHTPSTRGGKQNKKMGDQLWEG